MILRYLLSSLLSRVVLPTQEEIFFPLKIERTTNNVKSWNGIVLEESLHLLNVNNVMTFVNIRQTEQIPFFGIRTFVYLWNSIVFGYLYKISPCSHLNALEKIIAIFSTRESIFYYIWNGKSLLSDFVMDFFLQSFENFIGFLITNFK